MDFTAEAMQKTLDIAKPETFDITDVHGVTTVFSSKQLHQVKAEAPALAKLVEVSTLAGIADLVKAELEILDFEGQFVLHIQDEQTVAMKHKECDEYGRRLEIIRAKPVPFDRFKFGQWYDQESFVIAVATLFADTPDKDYVLKVASALINEGGTITEDDGLSQRATIKAGLRTKETTTIKPRVDLAPFRTFPEVPQPISSFVFRARCIGESPALMLVEADGGRWKIDAIQRIKETLEAFGLKIPIIA